MASVLAQVVLSDTNNLAADECENTFAFTSDHTTALDLVSAIEGAQLLQHFYNTPETGLAVADMIGSSIDRGSDKCLINYYDIAGRLDGGPHGSPVDVVTWTLGPRESGAVNLPREVAVCLSFHSDLTGLTEFSGSTRPKARHRGRVYIGPLVAAVFTAGQHPVVDSGRAAVITDAGDDLRAEAAAISGGFGVRWCVWSRTNAALYAVTGGWVDDAPDTVRGRGQKTTTRYTFP